ncbi:MAG: alpha-glucosidase [Chitinophagales bacterium]|nr:alpha-glucosidase [Chitinophagales bacterium]
MSWIQSTTIYQIYPRSFYDSNDDGIGDIQGIIQKLDYIKDLGFETIWISPFYTSPQQDFGYDIADYFSIDKDYGTVQDVEQLIEAAHQRKLKIVLDMVINHTSNQHPWFLESKQNTTNDKADWYIWRDKPNNWKSIIGTKAWHFVEERNQYYYTSFLPFQPDLNYQNETVKQTMFNVCKFWLDKGADGFRLDIFNCIIKDKHFRNNPFSLLHGIPTIDQPGGNFQNRKYSVNQPENFELAKDLRAIINQYQPDRLLLGEVFGEHHVKKQYLGNGNDGLHIIFLFDIIHFKFKASFFKERIKAYEKNYPFPYQPVVNFSNHDQWRSQFRLKNNINKAKLLTLLQMTMRAVPVSYYGEEIGMTNAYIPIKQAKDKLAHAFTWIPEWIAKRMPVPINRDNCRTPMQWNSNKNAGFSNANTTWLSVVDDYKQRNVVQAQADKDSLYYTYKTLLNLRKTNNSINKGKLNLIEDTPNAIIMYERIYETEKHIIILCFSNKKISIPLADDKYTILLKLNDSFTWENNTLELSNYNGLIFREIV